MARSKKTASKRANNTDGILVKPLAVTDLPQKRFDKTSKYIVPLFDITKKKQWFLIATFEKSQQANGIAQFLRKSTGQLPKGNWEFATRTMDDNRVGLYAQIAK